MDYTGFSAAHASESRCLEAVTACVGFDDFLDVAITHNHHHLDTLIVVTSHEDRRTQMVAKKHGVICVQTDLFRKNGRNFNKGAAINAGLARFQYHGWRLHLDSDILLPDNFRRILLNHTHLDPACLYGADRVDVLGYDGVRALHHTIEHQQPQAAHGFLIQPNSANAIGSRYVDPLRGYCPMGYFQLWHARNQHDYTYSIGTAAHDDITFADQWPASQRRHLPTVVCYHLVARPPVMGENWDGQRRQPRL